MNSLFKKKYNPNISILFSYECYQTKTMEAMNLTYS